MWEDAQTTPAVARKQSGHVILGGARWKDVCVTQLGFTCTYSDAACGPSSKSFPFMPSAWITLCSALCQVDRGGSADQLQSQTCYYYHQRGGSSPSSCAYAHLQRDRSRIGLFCLGNVYLCHRFAKGHGKALITGHDSIATTHYSFSVL